MTVKLKKNKIYFASDFHLGIPSIKKSHEREKYILKWLTEIEKDAKEIYLLGDIFDFWFEYKKVVPKGFIRLLGKLALLSDNGVKIHFFTGNHDLWANDYLKNEIGITIHRRSKIITLQGKKIFLGHGDGLGKGDYLYKKIKVLFTSKICQWAFSRLHPNFALYLAQTWSSLSRQKKESKFISEDKEILFEYCKAKEKNIKMDYYIFGHRHIPLQLKVNKNATYINLGDWITHNTYAILENGLISLKKYSS